MLLWVLKKILRLCLWMFVVCSRFKDRELEKKTRGMVVALTSRSVPTIFQDWIIHVCPSCGFVQHKYLQKLHHTRNFIQTIVHHRLKGNHGFKQRLFFPWLDVTAWAGRTLRPSRQGHRLPKARHVHRDRPRSLRKTSIFWRPKKKRVDHRSLSNLKFQGWKLGTVWKNNWHRPFLLELLLSPRPQSPTAPPNLGIVK